MTPRENPDPPPRHHPPPRRPVPFWALAIAILAVSLALVSPKTPTLLHSLRAILPHHYHGMRTLGQKILGFSVPFFAEREPTPISERPPCVLWMAPFLSGGGYSSEAWSYITALTGNATGRRIKLKIEQHGDLPSVEFWNGLPEATRELAYNLHNTGCDLKDAVVICHSEPGAWYPPLFETLPCPPSGYGDPRAVIGRTMFETDRLNAEHVRRCNLMDRVWVPTDFHVSTFVRSGVDPSKVVKVVQPVDVEFFDPSRYEPMVLPCAAPVIGFGTCRKAFVFLSIFKWEFRKGWDVLLKAYLKEFSASDGVALCLLTNPYHSDSDFGTKIKHFVAETGVNDSATNGLAPVHVIDTHIAQSDLPKLYKAADAFVLPSRGEGWGRPIVEAMAMSLPVIATNWSGPTEYLTEENGYPLPVERMSEVAEGPFVGHLWAEPSVERLRSLMRSVVDNAEEARTRGRIAREDMLRRFSPGVVAGIVAGEITKMSEKNHGANL